MIKQVLSFTYKYFLDITGSEKAKGWHRLISNIRLKTEMKIYQKTRKKTLNYSRTGVRPNRIYHNYQVSTINSTIKIFVLLKYFSNVSTKDFLISFKTSKVFLSQE